MGKGSDLVRLWPIEKDCRTGDLTVAQGSSSSDVEADLDDDHDETAVTHAEQPSQGGTSAGVLSGPLWGMPVDQAVLPEDFFDEPRALRRLRHLYARERLTSNVVFICAEPGMGKTYVATRFIRELESGGTHIQITSFDGMKSEQATKRLMRVGRTYAKGESTCQGEAILIDDFPATDECDLEKQRRAIERMAARGVLVIICMRPEAIQLVEELPEAYVVSNEDLIAFGLDDARILPIELEFMTKSVPALLIPLVGIGAEAIAQQARRGGSAYAKALGEVAELAVRDTLPMEEQRLRLAMLLLGKGDLDMLQLLVGRVDEESFVWLAHDVALLGIDVRAGSFCCAGEGAECGPSVLASALRQACASMPDIADKAVLALVAQGRYRRAAELSVLCTPQGCRDIVASWGTELVCAGESWLVAQVLGDGPAPSDAPLSERLACWSLGQLDNAAGQLDEVMPKPKDHDELTRTTVLQLRHAELLQACRDVMRGMLPGKRARRRDDDDELSCRLIDHIEASRLIFEGSFHGAYGMLLNNPARLRLNSLASALLCADYMFAALMVGEPPSEEEEMAFTAARELCANSGHVALTCYLSMVEPLAYALVGRAERIEGIEAAISRSERMNDRAVQALLLLAAAVVDNRTGAFSRAHVRAAQASVLVHGAAGHALSSAASMVGALASLSLGDPDPLSAVASRMTGTMVGRLVAQFLGGMLSEQQDVPVAMEPPINLTWALNVLGNDFGERSRAFREVAPKPSLAMMRRVVRAVGGHERATEAHALSLADFGSATPGRGLEARKPSDRVITKPRQARIRISLLGEFAVQVDGKTVPAGQLERRRARSIICHLAAQKGHKMSRIELVESIWPDLDYDKGRQRMYEAISLARSILGCRELGINPFVRARGEGCVALDELLVTCDVDQFEALARKALVEDDDDAIITYASDAMGLYRGPCCTVLHDSLGTYAARSAELRSLYVDVAVMGAGAAMKENRTSLAVRMAQAAYDANDMREDAAVVLMEALRLAGRTNDARDVYSNYARRMLDLTGMPPSQPLRNVVADLFPSQAGAGAAARRQESRLVLC